MNFTSLCNRTKQFIQRQLPASKIYQHVFVVGAQKAGTTALHSYLVNHPMIFGGVDKELAFFHRDAEYKKGSRYYRDQFPAHPSGTHALDSTPEYLYQKDSAQRIYNYRKDSKIIILLREPVSRAFSAFAMYQQVCPSKKFESRLQIANADVKRFYLPLADGSTKPSINYFLDREMAIIRGEEEGEEPALIRRGIYAPQLERYFRYFGSKNVLILFSDEMKRDSAQTVNRILDSIGLDPLPKSEYPLRHVREYTADTSAKDEIKRRASMLFEQDKQALQDVYGLTVPW
jgi:Sulfotransferase domain